MSRLTTPDPVAAHDTAQGLKTVLVVEDEEIVRDVVAATLREYGFSVILAADGLEGVECFRKHSNEISCVLLDLTMPGLSGREVLAELHSIRPEVPVLLTSGYDESAAVSGLPSKPAGFLQKPFTDSSADPAHPCRARAGG